jgi:exopolysaccharide biosynthesis polyprenyl glycosylphosphotransferase
VTLPPSSLLHPGSLADDREVRAAATAGVPSLLLRGEPARWRHLRRACWLIDVLLATAVALLMTPDVDGRAAVPAIAFAVCSLVLLSPRRTFQRQLAVGILDTCARAVTACAIAAMVAISIGAVLGTTGSTSLGLRLWILTSVLFCCTAAALGLVERAARGRGLLMAPTLVLGAGVVGTRVVRRLIENPALGLRPIGFLDADPLSGSSDPELGIPVLGAPADALAVAARSGARHVIVAFSWERDHAIAEIVRRCQAAGLNVSTVPRLFESVNGAVTLDYIGGLPLMSLRPVNPHGWRWTAKYGFERLAALVAVLVLAPLMLALALAVRLSSPGPAIYRQRRIGRGGRPFDLLKFRSMRLDDGAGAFDPGSGLAPGGVEGTERRTEVGRFLRNTSLDELPQLLNVLRGDMSLVGPRPERPEFTERFALEIPHYADRHRVKPGITGWAQVNGLRGQTSIEDRVEWDNHYIENWSLGLELRTLLLTIGSVLFFREEGAAAPALTDLAPDAVAADEHACLVVDSRLLVLSASPQAARLLGRSGLELAGLPITELLADAVTDRSRSSRFVTAVARAARGDMEQASAYVRPRGTFGIRSRARVSRADDPSAARIVLEDIADGAPGPAPRAPGELLRALRPQL